MASLSMIEKCGRIMPPAGSLALLATVPVFKTLQHNERSSRAGACSTTGSKGNAVHRAVEDQQFA
jgi:hypothetical protein